MNPLAMMVLDVTQKDVNELLQKARRARDVGQASFECQGWTIGVATIFGGDSAPIIQAIERLHAMRRVDWDQGFYRGDKLRGSL